MTKSKKSGNEKGRYNRDAFILVKRWQLCLWIAKAHHRSIYTYEQLLLIKENLDRQNLNP